MVSRQGRADITQSLEGDRQMKVRLRRTPVARHGAPERIDGLLNQARLEACQAKIVMDHRRLRSQKCCLTQGRYRIRRPAGAQCLNREFEQRTDGLGRRRT
jgi:hypothetical protein